MQLVKAYSIDVTIEGLVKRALVSIEVDHDEPSYDYWETSDVLETKASLLADNVRCIFISVSVKFADLDGFEGFDSLGCNFVRPSYYIDDILQSVKDHTMVLNAESDLVVRVLQGQYKLTNFLKGA